MGTFVSDLSLGSFRLRSVVRWHFRVGSLVLTPSLKFFRVGSKTRIFLFGGLRLGCGLGSLAQELSFAVLGDLGRLAWSLSVGLGLGEPGSSGWENSGWSQKGVNGEGVNGGGHIGIGIGKLPSKLERGVVGTTTGEQSKTKMTAQLQNPS